MKLSQYADSQGSALILDTGGILPDHKTRQLMCCRSLTLPVDILLLGPVCLSRPFGVMVSDLDGLPCPLSRREATLFAVFLRDAGYAGDEAVYVTDGVRSYAVPPGRHGWQSRSLRPDLAQLLGL